MGFWLSLRRRLHGRRGLKSSGDPLPSGAPASPPSRAAWIEMLRAVLIVVDIVVAAFTGGVD